MFRKTIFTLPMNCLFHPPRESTINVKKKDFLGQAKVSNIWMIVSYNFI